MGVDAARRRRLFALGWLLLLVGTVGANLALLEENPWNEVVGFDAVVLVVVGAAVLVKVAQE